MGPNAVVEQHVGYGYIGDIGLDVTAATRHYLKRQTTH